MPSSRAQRQSGSSTSWSRHAWSDAPWFDRARSAQRGSAARGLRESWQRLVESLQASRAAADELIEARDLLAYWEQRIGRLPRWALIRRREARTMSCRWRERVREAEQVRYGRGLLGAASQLAVERRMPTTVAHRGRQALRLAAYTAAVTALTFVLAVVATLVIVADAVLGAL